MVGPGMFKGLIETLVFIGLLIGMSLWGTWELIDLFFIDDSIRVQQPLKPYIELEVNNNKVDTIYVYEAP